jgi:hypothetical protein
MTRAAAAVAPAVGRATISSTGPAGTDLTVRTTLGNTTVSVGSLPDPARADDVGRRVDRILWQQLSTAGGPSRVYAVNRRRPVQLHVGTATALSLLDRGVPTVVRGGAAR